MATFTLVLAIIGGVCYAPQAIPWLVGLTITAAYWFTSSTSFANPAVTLARGFTTTFAGIAINHVPGFIVAEGRRPCAPASCEPRHGTGPKCDGRAVGSKEKGGRTWNQSSCRKLWLRQLLGRTVMTNLTISELLMLTCCGAFIASVTYAVKLSIEAF